MQQDGDGRRLREILGSLGLVTEREIEEVLRDKGHAKQEGTIRVDVSLLENQMNLVSELVLLRNRLLQRSSQVHDRELETAVHGLNGVTSDLRKNVMKARMQPVSQLYEKLPRQVRDISRDLGKTIQLETAGGDLTGDELIIRSRDEVGGLATNINTMQANLRKVIQAISENSQNVANASEEFSSVSQQISANSEETSAQASAVASATEQVNRYLQTVATATEEMSASISEIAKNATESAKIAGAAMQSATETNAIVTELGASSAEIGQVIKAITSIAQKTDLLALNATVEAARAGEVGAGFAVVANEVKELAKQTATATEDISRKIEAIQTDAKAAVTAIGSISGIIAQVNAIAGTIAAAVEEQSATANEMSRNLTEAAKGAGEVGQNIHGVAQAAQSTSQGATDSLKASQQLAQLSHKLRQLVEQFKLEKYAGDSARRTYVKSSDRQETITEHEPREEVLSR
jgi:methyl-accepting chemotaxis protein